MKSIIVALRELKSALLQIAVVDTVLDTLLVFMISYIIATLFLFPLVAALIPATLFLIYSYSAHLRRVHARDVEEKVPILKHQLTTVSDNVDKDNEIVNELQRDVLNLMKHIRLSYFIDFKKIWRRIMFISLAAFAIIILAAWNVHFIDYQDIVRDISSLTDDTGGIGAGEGFGQGIGGEGNFSDIFGNETLAELGSEELDLQINPVLSEINIEDIQEAQDRDFQESLFPEDITATTDSSFDENIPKEHREIVKTYFSKIAEVQ